MELSPRRLGDVIVLGPAGRIDHLNADDFRAALEPHLAACSGTGPALLFDLSALEYISSAGLRVLMIAAKSMRARKARIGVAALTPTVAEIFTISRFDAVVEVYAGVREALAAMSPSALAALAADPARGGP